MRHQGQAKCKIVEVHKKTCSCSEDYDSETEQCVAKTANPEVEFDNQGRLLTWEYDTNNQGLRCPAIVQQPEKPDCDNGSDNQPSVERGNPVNCHTGRKTQREIFATTKGGLVLSATYRSGINDQAGDWKFFDYPKLSIKSYPGSDIATATIEFPSGAKYLFKNEASDWDSFAATEGDLSESSEGGYSYVSPAGNEYHFNKASGNYYLTSKVTAVNGDQTSLYYSGNQLSRITDHLGYSYSLDYNSQGQLAQATSIDGLRTGFSYNASGMLQKVHFNARQAVQGNLADAHQIALTRKVIVRQSLLKSLIKCALMAQFLSLITSIMPAMVVYITFLQL